MNEEKIKQNWFIVGAIGIGITILVLTSIINTMLIFLVLICLTAVSITNMVRLERMKGLIEKDDEPEETPQVENGIPDVNVLKENVKEAEIKVNDYIKRNLEKGATPEEIYQVLAPTYGEELVKSILVKYLKVEPETKTPEPVEEGSISKEEIDKILPPEETERPKKVKIKKKFEKQLIKWVNKALKKDLDMEQIRKLLNKKYDEEEVAAFLKKNYSVEPKEEYKAEIVDPDSMPDIKE